ncbi:MAG: NADH-ubiquinone oxidoreductase-F iron-sulfur binding region domain-containing protein [Patescibacteria group bacterium]
MSEDIVKKIEEAGLIGRGGAGYPTAKKWKEVASMEADRKYVICNASEGEIGLFKDIFILDNYPEMVVKGMILALDYLGSKEALFNINQKYYGRAGQELYDIVNNYNHNGYYIGFYIKKPNYIGGEETALLNAIEGERTEPRMKPPYPSEEGLFGKPTIINNVETFYNVALVDEGSFENKRFYSISGEVKNPGVYRLPADWEIEKVLQETDNYPDFEFFAQIGGSASGEVLNQEQLKERKMSGAGGLEVYNIKRDPKDLLERWFDFYRKESCGKCTPCRMGSHQLFRLLQKNDEIPWKDIFKLLEATESTSFCGLGRSISVPVLSYYSNVLKEK